MGKLAMLSRARRADEAKKPAVALSRKLQRFYAEHAVSKFQRAKVSEIRAMYQEKQQGLDVAHNIASSKLSEEYMYFELEYLQTSQRMKKEGDGYEPFHHDMRALWSPAFYKWVGRKMDAFFSILKPYGQEN